MQQTITLKKASGISEADANTASSAAGMPSKQAPGGNWQATRKKPHVTYVVLKVVIQVR